MRYREFNTSYISTRNPALSERTIDLADANAKFAEIQDQIKADEAGLPNTDLFHSQQHTNEIDMNGAWRWECDAIIEQGKILKIKAQMEKQLRRKVTDIEVLKMKQYLEDKHRQKMKSKRRAGKLRDMKL
jgi:hypothetical protein